MQDSSSRIELVGVGNPASFATSFPPEAQLVSAVRRFVSDFYSRVLGDTASSSFLALATHELLENAVRYCAHGDVTIRVSVSAFRSRHLVRVRTRNAARPTDTANLRRLIKRMEAEPDAVAFYETRMRETVGEAKGSGLGIPRICAEAGMEIKCTTTGSEVGIAAQALLGAEDD